MHGFHPLFRALGAVLFAIGVLSACSQSHSANSTFLPGLAGGDRSADSRSVHAFAAVAGGDVVALNAGGGASGNFAADTDFAAHQSWTFKVTNPVNTSGLTNPGPAAVYQDEREGSTIAYTIPGLTPGAAYTVRLSFAELFFTAAGQRVFNVSINGSNVLTNFDVFATTGARDKAVAESFAATASSTGTIAITLTAKANYAAINAIEIAGAGSATPTPPPTGTSVLINSGGSASGNFAADEDYVAHGTWTSSSSKTIATNGVTGPAPQAVYQDQRYGPTVSYVIPGLTAGAAYTVRLDFAELFWTAAGKRTFSISINSTKVLSNFDIFATAGAANTAVAESFTATASATGTIAITLTAVTNYAAINGIEIVPGSGAPATPAPVGFNDYSTFGYDNERDVFNPNSTAITPANLSSLHLAWQARLGGGDYNTQSQPVLATEIPNHAGVLFVDGGKGNVYGYDALTGTALWTTHIGQETYSFCGGGTSYFGMGGTVAYDPASKSIYVVGNTNPTLNAFASNSLYHLDAATGTILGQVDFVPAAAGPSELNFSHTSVTLNNGVAYVGTGSTCDISSWRGRVVAVNVPSMTIANTFFTVWDPNNSRGAGAQPWGGGGVWGWGGVSLDFSGNVLTGVGNADNGLSNGKIQAPFVAAPEEYSGYGETLLELSPDISTAIASNHPIPVKTYSRTATDIDVQGTPLVFRPNGTSCDTMVALQGKSGELTLYNEHSINSGNVAQYQLSPSNADGGYLGNPAYSPATGLMYADVETSESPTLFDPGLMAINPGCGSPSVAWHATFGADSSATGTPRSVPAASAGGVLFAGSVNGSGGDVWALNASTGAILNGGAPILPTSGHLRMPATIDGNWVFVLDNVGNMYGLTIDPTILRFKPHGGQPIHARARAGILRTARVGNVCGWAASCESKVACSRFRPAWTSKQGNRSILAKARSPTSQR